MITVPQSTTQPLTTGVELTTTAAKPTPLTTTVLVSFTSDENFDQELKNSTSPKFTDREQKVKREVCCVENYSILFKVFFSTDKVQSSERTAKNVYVQCIQIWT